MKQNNQRGLHEAWPKQIKLTIRNEREEMTYYCPKVWIAHKIHALRQWLRGLTKGNVNHSSSVPDKAEKIIGGLCFDKIDSLRFGPLPDFQNEI